MSSSSLRARSVCVLIFGTLVAAQAPALSLSTAHADEPTPGAYTESSIRIATFNTDATNRAKRAIKDLKALAAQGPDIIALQELANPDRKQFIRASLTDCETCIYDIYMPAVAVPGSTPILYRSDRFALEAAETVQVTKPTYVGPRGAGPSTIRAKFVNMVRLRDLTSGRALNLFNNHTVPSVQGRNGGPNTHNRKRLNIYRKHMTGLRAFMTRVKEASGGLMFVTGDLNVNYRKDRVLQPPLFPYYNMTQMKMRASFDPLGEPRIGTHTLGNGNDTRLIDYVYSARRPAITPVAQQILTGLNADHRPLLVDFTLSPSPSPPPPPPPAE